MIRAYNIPIENMSIDEEGERGSHEQTFLLNMTRDKNEKKRKEKERKNKQKTQYSFYRYLS